MRRGNRPSVDKDDDELKCQSCGSSAVNTQGTCTDCGAQGQ